MGWFMKICDFVEFELEKFRKECNFTEEEGILFDMRAKGMSLVQVQMAMHDLYPCSESKINRLSKSVTRKILKVL